MAAGRLEGQCSRRAAVDCDREPPRLLADDVVRVDDEHDLRARGVAGAEDQQ